MLGRKLFSRRSRVHRSIHSRAITQTAARLAVCETLEARQLLTQFTFNVPQNDGYTAVYLVPAIPQGWVDVFKNSPTGTPVHTFTGDNNNGTGMYIVDAGGLSNFLFVDQVPAARKPLGSPGNGHDNGIRVRASNASLGHLGHLKIEAPANDQLIRVTESTSTSATVTVTGPGGVTGNSRIGAGVDKLTIQTHDSGHATVKVATAAEFVGDVNLPGLHPDTSLTITAPGVSDRVLLGGAPNASVDAIVHTGADFNEVLLNQDVQGNGTTVAFVDFDPNLGGQLGNKSQLWVGQNHGTNCLAILGRAPDAAAHQVTVDLVIVTNGSTISPVPGARAATLIVQDSATIGALEVSHAGQASGLTPEAFVDAPLTVPAPVGGWTTGQLIADGTVSFADTSAPSTVYEFAISDTLSTSGLVNVNMEADVTALTSSQIRNLNIGVDAKFTLQERVGTPLPPPKVLTVASLHIDKTATAPEGMLDLKNNSMIVDYTGDSPLDEIQALITKAYNGDPRWTGFGINSSIAADVAANNNLPHKTGIGYGEATDIFSTFNPVPIWDGQQLNDTMILVKYTWYGDATLDGMVNLADFNRTAANFNQSPRRWTQGDFTYDTIVNLADFNRLAGNFGQSGLGGGDPQDCEELTLEELQDLWEEATS